jgi:uncharacterized membrane protein
MLILTLRLLHIMSGVLWVGALFFTSVYLNPAIAEAGPAGGRVMEGLQKRNVMAVLPALGITTLVSGFWLFWIVSGGMNPAYHQSRMGMALGTGGILALLGFIVGMAVMRPAMMRAAAIAQGLAGMATDEERERATDDINRLRSRAAASSKLVISLVLLATAAMAVARYL